MKRAVLIVLGCIGLAAASASAQVDNYTCYKAKDLKTPQFAGSTINSVTDEFGSQANVEAKKPFLYCTPASLNGGALLNPTTKLNCYKVKGPGFAADSTRAVTDTFGTVNEAVKKKTFVLCVPATAS